MDQKVREFLALIHQKKEFAKFCAEEKFYRYAFMYFEKIILLLVDYVKHLAENKLGEPYYLEVDALVNDKKFTEADYDSVCKEILEKIKIIIIEAMKLKNYKILVFSFDHQVLDDQNLDFMNMDYLEGFYGYFDSVFTKSFKPLVKEIFNELGLDEYDYNYRFQLLPEKANDKLMIHYFVNVEPIFRF